MAKAVDPAAGGIRLIIHGGRVNIGNNGCLHLFTRLPGKKKHLFTRQSVYPAAVQMTFIHPIS